MTKTFDDIVSAAKDPRPNWQVEVDGTEYTKNLDLVEFRDEINNPIEFTVKLDGVDGATNIPEDSEVVIKKAGAALFRGTVQQVNPDILQSITLKGAGYAAELEGDVSQQFSSTTVTSVVNTLVDGTSLPNGRTLSTSFDLSSTVNVDDFRVNKTQLEDVNRLMGEYDLEWYITFDGSNNPVFNVTDQLQSDDGSGGSIGTITTYGADQTAEQVGQNVNRNEGSYDGVVVRGYGDGDDQVTASAGSTGKGNRVLIYTDKTIISDSQAQQRADNLNSSKGVAWQEIEVKPNNPNRLYSIGDLLTVDAEDAKLSDDYRVVQTHFKIWPGENQFESTLNLSNKPQTFLSGFKTEKEKREGQTDHMQGSRNTINESNTDLADSGNGLTLDFQIPGRFTQDITGQDRTTEVRLDYKISDYKKLLDAANQDVFDTNTKVVDTTVNDFGDVEIARTETRNDNEGDLNQDTVQQPGEVVGGAKSTSGSYTSQEGTFVIGDSISLGFTPIQGTFVEVQLVSDDTNTRDIWAELNDINGDGNNESVLITDFEGFEVDTFPVTGQSLNQGNIDTELIEFVARADGTNFFPNDGDPSNDVAIRKKPSIGIDGSATADFSLYIPGDFSGDDIDLFFNHISFSGNADNESWSVIVTYYTIEEQTVGPSSNQIDNVDVFMRKQDTSSFDAGVGGGQDTDDVPDTGTKTIGQLDSNDTILTEETTNATQASVFVNGTEISGSPFSSLEKADIDIDLGLLSTPGSNTIEVVPDSKAEVKANVIAKHKLEGEG